MELVRGSSHRSQAHMIASTFHRQTITSTNPSQEMETRPGVYCCTTAVWYCRTAVCTAVLLCVLLPAAHEGVPAQSTMGSQMLPFKWGTKWRPVSRLPSKATYQVHTNGSTRTMRNLRRARCLQCAAPRTPSKREPSRSRLRGHLGAIPGFQA